MATVLKKSFALHAILLFSIIMLALSCKQPHPQDEVCIPVPKDTSALGKIDHFIPLDELDQFKRDFIPQRDSISRRDANLFIPVSEAFNKAALIDILKDPESVGIRIYYGVKKGAKINEVRLILVGVNAQGKDLYFTKGSAVAAQAGGRLGGNEYGQCLPPCQ